MTGVIMKGHNDLT